MIGKTILIIIQLLGGIIVFIITDVIFGAILEFLKSVFTLTDKVETKFDKEISIKYEEKSKRKLWKTNNNRYLELNI